MKINIGYILFIICLYLLIFQNFIQTYIPIVKFFDEILSLMFIPILVIYLIKNKGKLLIKKNDFIIVICLLIILVIGLYSNFTYKIQSFKSVISDMLLVYKFFMVYYLSSLLWHEDNLVKHKNKIIFHIKLIIVILVGLTFLNYTFNLYPNEMRFGIKSNRLFYSHSTYLAATCVFIIAIFIKYEKNWKSFYFISIILVLISTLRFKAIASVFAILIIVIYLTKSNKKLSISKIMILGMVCIGLTYNQIAFYFFKNDGFARKELLETSFKIAKDYFPIGTGFATYCSHFSIEPYSNIYYKYNLNNIYGITPKNPAFVTDSFWPMLLGQFGYIGIICYGICLVKIFLKIQLDYSKENKYLYISKIICLIYLLISSTSESAFSNSIAIPLAILIGIDNKNYRKSELNE